MGEQANNERVRLQEMIRSLENHISELQTESRRALDEKDRVWSELTNDRSKETIKETKEAFEKESDIRQ